MTLEWTEYAGLGVKDINISLDDLNYFSMPNELKKNTQNQVCKQKKIIMEEEDHNDTFFYFGNFEWFLLEKLLLFQQFLNLKKVLKSFHVLFSAGYFWYSKKVRKKLDQTWLGLGLGKNLNNQSTNQPRNFSSIFLFHQKNAISFGRLFFSFFHIITYL